MSDLGYSKLLKKLEKNLFKYSMLISIIFLIILSSIIYYIQIEKFKAHENKLHTQIDVLYKNKKNDSINNLSIIIKKILHDNKVIQLFKNKKRNQLYLYLVDDWGFLVQNNMYLKVLQFHNADGTSFLRMHMSSRHSDNISKKRKMLREIHKNHKMIIGYEKGEYATVLRVIKPIFSDGKYIGALEIGIDLNYFIDNLKKVLNIKGFVFSNKEKFEKFSDIYDLELNNMVMEYVNNKDDLYLLKKIPKNYDFKKSINIKLKHRNKHYYIVPIDIKDFQDQSVAKILIVDDITDFINNQEGINIISIIIMLLIISIFYYLINKYTKFFEKMINTFFTDIINGEKDQKNYLKIVENISSNFSVTTDGKHIISINDTCLKFLNYSTLEEFKKKHDCICDFFYPENGFVHKKMGELDWITYAIKNNHKQNRVLIKKNKKDYIFLLTVQKFVHKEKDRYLAILTDISELSNLQKKFEYIIKRNNFAEEGANIGLWDWDLTNDKVYYSYIWKFLLGYEKNEISDELNEWHSRIYIDDIEEVIQNLDEHFEKKTDYFINEHRLKHKNGSFIYTQFRGKAIFENNLPIRMVGVYTDITKEQKALDTIKEQEKLMIAQSRQAAMGEMISMIAHQWRQPIASIAMGINNIQLDMELDSINNKDLKIECDEIIEQTKYLSGTIDDFRNFFKEDKEKVLISIESVIEDSLKLMNKSLENNNITITKEYFHTDKIETLPREILQILINLIKNAKEILVEKEIEHKYIKIFTTEDENYIYIDVQDNGKGIDDDIIHKIFQPYFTTKDEYNGTGLGLYMSKTIAQKHLEGNLTVKNSKDGAIFTLSIKKIKNCS